MGVRRILFPGFVLLALACPAAGQERTLRAAKISEPIVVDGLLEESAWLEAEPAADFIQSEPRQGQPGTERTEVRVVYDADNLFVAFQCYDSSPGEIAGNSLRVDFSPTEEDFVQIVLDPFASGRDGFLFTVNPYGAKRDEQIGGGGAQSNASWNAVWDVRTQRHARGWNAEIQIPFKTLRYSSTSTAPWLVNFGRQIRRHNEIVNWSEIPRQFTIRQVEMAGRLEGIDMSAINPGRNLQATPFLVFSDSKRSGNTKTNKDGGFDLKYGLTPSLTLDLSYRTDFSHVEVDQQQVNLDRFRLNFPEKRGFFLENADIFVIGNTPNPAGRPDPEAPLIFYSRNIGLSLDGTPISIEGGGRLTGRVGRYGIGAMSIQTDREADVQGRENASVFRIRRDVLTRSFVGGFAMSRDGPERPANRVYGFDGMFQPTRELAFQGFFAKSHTTGVHGKDWLLRLEQVYDSRRMRLNIVHANIQENFKNDLGFVVRPGVMMSRFDLRPRFRPWSSGPIREIMGHTNVRVGPESGGEHRLLTREIGFGFDVYQNDGGHWRYRRRLFYERLDEDFDIRRGITVASGEYRTHEDGIEFETNRSRTLSGTLKAYTGPFWDGDKKSLDLTVTVKTGAHFNATVSYSQNGVDLPAGEFNTKLSGLRVQYSFNTRMFTDMLIQYNNETERLTSNVRFNWIHRPLSDLFLVYTEERPTVSGVETDRAVSVKYTHRLSF